MEHLVLNGNNQFAVHATKIIIMKKFEIKYWYTLWINGMIPSRKLWRSEIITAANKELANDRAGANLLVYKRICPRLDDVTVNETNILKSVLSQHVYA